RVALDADPDARLPRRRPGRAAQAAVAACPAGAAPSGRGAPAAAADRGRSAGRQCVPAADERGASAGPLSGAGAGAACYPRGAWAVDACAGSVAAWLAVALVGLLGGAGARRAAPAGDILSRIR